MTSSAQTIAAAGLVNGQGIKVSAQMTDQFAQNNSKPIVSVINNMYATSANTVSNVAGLYNSIQSLPKWVTGRNGNTSVSADATASANQIMGTPGDPNSTKVFASTLGQTAGYAASTIDWHASIQQYQGKNFDDLGLQNSSYTDVASGGLTGHFAVLKQTPGGTRIGFQSFGSAIAGFGNSIDVSNLSDVFGPAQLVVRMRSYGLGPVGDIDNNLASLNIYTDQDVKNANSKIIRNTLNLVNRPNDVATVISILEIKIPSGIKIDNLGDLVDSNKMLPIGIKALAPTGNMSDLNEPLGNMGGTFKDAAALGKFLGQAEVPEYPNLNGMSSPLPSSYIDNLAGSVGFGPVPGGAIDGYTELLGTGPIGNPTVKDMIGSAAGIGYTDNFRKINAAHDSINNSQAGQELYSALNDIYIDDKNGGGVSPGLVSTLNTKIAAFNTAVATDPQIKSAEQAMVASVFQGLRQASLLSTAGINLASPPAITAVTGVLAMAGSLPRYGVDKQQLGFKEMFTNIADTSTVYGEAIQVALLEGRNQSRQSLSSVPDNITADPIAILGAKIQADASKDLTDQQKQNIINEAQSQGVDPAQALSNAKSFGYQNDYYVKKGYPSA